MRNPEQPPIYQHDKTDEDLDVSQGVELQGKSEHYTNRLDTAAGAHQESINELKEAIDKQDHEEIIRALGLVESEYNGIIILAKQINEKLEAEIKVKYEKMEDESVIITK